MPTLRQVLENSEATNDRIVLRILQGTRCHDYEDLAACFSMTEDALRMALQEIQQNGIVSDAWLVLLMRVHNVHPEWVMSGCGPCVVYVTPEGQYENHDAFMSRQTEMEALRGLSSYALAQELLRRLAAK